MKKSILFIFIIISFQHIIAQATYNFDVLNEPYLDISNGTSLNDGNFWDADSYLIPFGFQFQLNAYNFNSLFIIEDGTGGILSNTISLDSGQGAFLIPILQDLVDLGDIDENTSLTNISYIVDGAVGNQIFKLEYNNVGFFDDVTSSDFINFQVWLYESTNVIEYRYGASQINNPDDSYQGLSGLSIGLFPSLDGDNQMILDTGYVLGGNPDSPTIIQINAGGDIDDFAIIGSPESGTVYRFTPGVLAINEFSQTDFSMVPNPTTDYFSVQTKENIQLVTIHNNLGQKVKEFKDRFDHLTISEIPAGVYFVTVTSNNESVTKKMIKQ